MRRPIRGTADREQIAKNESLFRDVNERIAEASDRFNSDDAVFMCECADAACTERIEVPLEEYEQVREAGTHFLLAPGHVEPTVERVVRNHRRYEVVEKIDAVVARVARRLDPRTEPA